MNIPFGSKVRVTAFPLRIKEGSFSTFGETRVSYTTTPCNFEGILLSATKLAEGTITHMGGDGNEWKASKYLKAYWVCEEGKDPVKVLEKDIEAL